MFANVAQDIRYGCRQLRRTPVFAAVAVLTLALGIGANTAVFSVMNAVLLKSLPVSNPQELVYLHTSNFPGGQTGYGDTSMRMQVYQALRQQTDVFSDLMAWVPLSTSAGIAVRFDKEPEEAKGDMVSGNFFAGLGVSAVRGRLFTMEDEQNHTSNVVLSYDYWTRRLLRDPSVVGRAMFIKGVPFTIIGVAGPGFVGLDEGGASDLWIPFQDNALLRPWGSSVQRNSGTLYGGRWWFLLTIGRLRPGVAMKQAEVRLNPIFQRAADEGLTPDDYFDPKKPVLTLSDTRGLPGLREAYETPLKVLMGMVGLVLVIACGNVAMLLLARNAARQREFSLRMALGSRRTRLFVQLLTEAMLLVISGAALGWIFGLWATRQLAKWALLDWSLAPDLRVLWFTIAVSVAVGLVFGLAPLRSAVSIPLGVALKSTAATSHQDRHRHRSGQVVIALHMALCLVLLVGAGLLVRTLRNLENVNLGLKPNGLLVFGVNPQQHASTKDEYIQFYTALLQRMRALPGVESATLMQNRLGSGWSSNTTAYIDGQQAKSSQGGSGMRWNAAGPDFFHVLGIPIKLGRDITDADSAAAPPVVVVNETFVKRYLNDTSPLGHMLSFSSHKEDTPYTIVGVAEDSKYTSVREEAKPMAWFPYVQTNRMGAMQVELRVSGPPSAMLPIVRRAMTEFAPDVAMLEPMTQVEQFDKTLSQDRLFARLSTFFGLLAVLLVATGLYGTLAYKVARRTTEIGVRMALGAERWRVLWLVVRESLALCAVGALVGLPVAIAGVRLLKSMLYGLQPGDPFTFALALAGIALVALAASLIPARRAASVDPMVALRSE